MNRKLCLLGITLVALLLNNDFTPAARATITVLNYYRLGENDPGAVAGNIATNSLDLTGRVNLAAYNSPLYSADVATDAATDTGSSLSAQFNGAEQYFDAGAPLTSQVNNFGIEAWVKLNPNNSTGYIIAYNGNPQYNGWGISGNGNQINGLYGSITFFSGTTVPTNIWIHVALVCSNGVGTVYTNGVPAGTQVNATPYLPMGGFGIGGSPQVSGLGCNGLIDEVRVFTFAAGQFNPNDLLFNQKGPPQASSLPATMVTATSATLNGQTAPNGPSTTVFFAWGTNTPYGNTNQLSGVLSGNSIVAVSTNLSGLLPATTYHYQVWATNIVGANFSSDAAFTTLAAAPLVSVLPASGLMGNTATLSGQIIPEGEATTVSLVWGVSAGYGNTNQFSGILNGYNSQPVSVNVSNLVAGTVYHYRIVAANAAGVTWGPDVKFWAANIALNGGLSVTNPAGVVFVDPGFTVIGSPTAIAGGNEHALALKADGTVVGWGLNDAGQTTPPAIATNVIAIAAAAE